MECIEILVIAGPPLLVSLLYLITIIIAILKYQSDIRQSKKEIENLQTQLSDLRNQFLLFEKKKYYEELAVIYNDIITNHTGEYWPWNRIQRPDLTYQNQIKYYDRFREYQNMVEKKYRNEHKHLVFILFDSRNTKDNDSQSNVRKKMKSYKARIEARLGEITDILDRIYSEIQ